MVEETLEQVQESKMTAEKAKKLEEEIYAEKMKKKAEAMEEVVMVDLKDVIDFDAVRVENIIAYSKDWTFQYLNSMVWATITVPEKIKYNQMVIEEFEKKLETLAEDDPARSWIMATIAETVQQIITHKQDIENRLDNAETHHNVLKKLEQLIEACTK